MKTMYPAQANSPVTELAAEIDAIQTTIPLVDATRLPAAPNLATIGTDDSAETVLYTGVSGNDLTGVTRGFQGEAKSWVAGSKVARYLTAYDIDTMRENISENNESLEDHVTDPDAHPQYAKSADVNELLAEKTNLTDYVRQPGYAATSGTATAYTVALTPAPTTLPDGFGITIVPHVANGANPTLKIGNLTAVPLKDQKGLAFAAGKLQAGKPYAFRKVGSDFLADSGSGAEGDAAASDLRLGKKATVASGDVITGTLAERTTTSIIPGDNQQNFPSGIYPAFTVSAAQKNAVRGTTTVPANSTATVPLGFQVGLAALGFPGTGVTMLAYWADTIVNGGLSGLSGPLNYNYQTNIQLYYLQPSDGIRIQNLTGAAGSCTYIAVAKF